MAGSIPSASRLARMPCSSSLSRDRCSFAVTPYSRNARWVASFMTTSAFLRLTGINVAVQQKKGSAAGFAAGAVRPRKVCSFLVQPICILNISCQHFTIVFTERRRFPQALSLRTSMGGRVFHRCENEPPLSRRLPCAVCLIGMSGLRFQQGLRFQGRVSAVKIRRYVQVNV